MSQVLMRRLRRNRKSAAVRQLVEETRLHAGDLISAHFVIEGESIREEISSMPGVYRLSIDCLLAEIEKIHSLGVHSYALFPVIPKELKDPEGREALNPDGLLLRAIRAVKYHFPDLCFLADVALDPYTSHGHDGLIGEECQILNDETVEILAQMALLQADAGIDVVAPSDMMDGRVARLRQALDQAGFWEVSIHAYAAKYASSFYGPFRDALFSHLEFGDKQSYQLNPANAREALLEAAVDEAEGADILMVKPALAYLDIISKLRAHTLLPISAYQVSGEYSMVMAAAQRGWLDAERVLWEMALSIKRAGADMLLTYAAPLLARRANQ